VHGCAVTLVPLGLILDLFATTKELYTFPVESTFMNMHMAKLSLELTTHRKRLRDLGVFPG